MFDVITYICYPESVLYLIGNNNLLTLLCTFFIGKPEGDVAEEV